MSLKFEHIVFYGCTHTGGIIRRLSAATQDAVQIPATPQSAIAIVHHIRLKALLTHYTKIPLLQNTVHISFTA